MGRMLRLLLRDLAQIALVASPIARARRPVVKVYEGFRATVEVVAFDEPPAAVEFPVVDPAAESLYYFPLTLAKNAKPNVFVAAWAVRGEEPLHRALCFRGPCPFKWVARFRRVAAALRLWIPYGGFSRLAYLVPELGRRMTENAGDGGCVLGVAYSNTTRGDPTMLVHSYSNGEDFDVYNLAKSMSDAQPLVEVLVAWWCARRGRGVAYAATRAVIFEQCGDGRCGNPVRVARVPP